MGAGVYHPVQGGRSITRLRSSNFTARSAISSIIMWHGSRDKSERSDRFFLGWDFAIRTVSMETVISCLFFVSESRQIQNKHGRVPYNIYKLLTNLAKSRAWLVARAVQGNIGPPSFLYVLPRPRANILQYGPRARLVRG